MKVEIMVSKYPQGGKPYEAHEMELPDSFFCEKSKYKPVPRFVSVYSLPDEGYEKCFYSAESPLLAIADVEDPADDVAVILDEWKNEIYWNPFHLE